MSMPSTSTNASSRALSILRGAGLAAALGASLWLGAKALRDAPTVGEGTGGPPPAQEMSLPPASVFVSPVREKVAQEKYRVTGNLRAVARAEVAAKEPGALEKILVDEGDTVKKKQVLAVLDRRRIDAEIAEAAAAVTAAEVLVTQRKAESKRAETDFTMKTGLFQKRAVSQTELLDAEREKLVAAAQVKAASDQLNVAKSRLALLRVRETDLEIEAPFDGRVVERHVEPGEWLGAGAPVVSLVSTGEIEAWLDVPERYAATISSDPSALRIYAKGGDLTTTATAVKRIAEVDMRSRLFPVVATLDDHGGKLIHGMSVHADLPVGKREPMLVVSVSAVISSRLGDFVYRVNDGAGGPMPSAEKVGVKVRFRRDGQAYLERTDGLAEGDRVIQEGNERLMPGQPLVISKDTRSEKLDSPVKP